jgi:hypothetical protein
MSKKLSRIKGVPSDFVASFFVMAMACRVDGLKRYGKDNTWNHLGPKGVFADMARKFNRIKAMIWDETVPCGQETSETCADTLMDLAVYCAFMAESIAIKHDLTEMRVGRKVYDEMSTAVELLDAAAYNMISERAKKATE